MANWTNEPQPFGANHAPLIEGLSSVDGVTPVPVAVNPANGSLLASVVSGGGGGTQYVEGATTSPGTGTLSIGRYNLVAPTLTNGELYGLQLDSSGNLKVTGSLSVGGTTDNSAFTAGTSTGTPAMGFYHSTIDTVTDGRSAAVGITSKRAMLVNLQTAAGSETGIAALPLQVSLANTSSNATAVKVDGSAVTQPVSLTSTTITGTVAVTQSGSWTNTVTQATAASLNATVVGTGTFAVQAAQSGTWNITNVSGTVSDVRQATAANLNATVVGTGTFAVQNTPVAPTTIFDGKTTVTTAGTRVTLAASQAVQSVTIKALSTNTGVIYVGNASVASTNGFQLAAGDSVSMDISNLNTVNIDSSVNGEGVTYLGVN